MEGGCFGASASHHACSLLSPSSSLSSTLANNAATPPRPTLMDPQPLASLPPSPVEEDIGKASAAWHEESTSGSTLAEGSRSPPAGGRRSKDKGKSRERDTGYRDDAGESSDEEVAEGYPPTKEEEAEARRVEEVRPCHLFCYHISCTHYLVAEFAKMGGSRASAAEGCARVSTEHGHQLLRPRGRYTKDVSAMARPTKQATFHRRRRLSSCTTAIQRRWRAPR